MDGERRKLIGRGASPDPVESYFERAHRMGFNWLELGCESPINFPHTFCHRRIDRVKELGREYGITYCLHSASYVNTAELMPTVREAVEQHLIEYLHLAARLEATHLVIHCGYHFSQFMGETYEALLTTLERIVPVAEGLGMPMLVENMNVLPPEAEILYLGCTVEELKVVFDHIQSPYLGLALDVGHAHLVPGGVAAFVEAFGPRIVGLHLHDNDGIIDRHWPVGSGTVDWPALLSRLHEIGYAGSYTIELRKEESVARSWGYLQRIGIAG